jgi:hypothetical protein
VSVVEPVISVIAIAGLRAGAARASLHRSVANPSESDTGKTASMETNTDYLRRRAERCRTLAETSLDPARRQNLRELARLYDWLLTEAERRDDTYHGSASPKSVQRVA